MSDFYESGHTEGPVIAKLTEQLTAANAQIEELKEIGFSHIESMKSYNATVDELIATIARINDINQIALSNVKKFEKHNDELQAHNAVLREALEKLARLGNGDMYGNSNGNVIAQQALSTTPAEALERERRRDITIEQLRRNLQSMTTVFGMDAETEIEKITLYEAEQALQSARNLLGKEG